MNPSKTHGAFSWPELMTSDPEAAAEFYAQLFGFTIQTAEMESGPYTMLMDGEMPMAGIMGLPDPNIPPAWVFYVTVDDADGSIEKAKDLGAEQSWPLTDVQDVGRMTGFADPHGAYLNIITYSYPDMEPGTEPNFTDNFRKNGAFSWFELRSSDVEAAKQFYAELFGWTFEEWPMENGSYPVIKVGDVGVGGMLPPPMPGMPNHWAGYITADDADAVGQAAVRAGGQIVAAMDIPTVGRVNVISDKQGAVVNVITYMEPAESSNGSS